jgi:hypothetical protein
MSWIADTVNLTAWTLGTSYLQQLGAYKHSTVIYKYEGCKIYKTLDTLLHDKESRLIYEYVQNLTRTQFKHL